MNEGDPLVPTELLERARAGDEEASDRLVELLYPRVARIVRNHIRQESDQQDVIQEVFVKLFLKMGQYRGLQPFEHWVSRVTVTTCYDWLRKRRARPLHSFSDLSESEAGFVERTLQGKVEDDSIHQRELLDGLLDKLIDRLNPREQIVIRLLDLEELSIKEVQDATGWSAPKIKTIAMRARRKLSEHLRRLEGESGPP